MNLQSNCITSGEISARVSILDIVAETVSLTQKGNRYWGLCPFHDEKTPSFTVTPDRNMYYCFGCHAGGDVFAYLMKRDGLSFKEALNFLADRAGLFSSPQLQEKARKTIQEKKRVDDLGNDLLDAVKAGLREQVNRERWMLSVLNTCRTIELQDARPIFWPTLRAFSFLEYFLDQYYDARSLAEKMAALADAKLVIWP